MKRKGCLIVIFAMLVFASCKPLQEENELVPAYIMEEQLFVDVLTDSYLSEGASGVNVKNVMGTQFDSTYAFNPLKDRGVDKMTFDSTVAYYSRHPKKFKLIYDQVLDKLSQILAAGKLEK